MNIRKIMFDRQTDRQTDKGCSKVPQKTSDAGFSLRNSLSDEK